MRKICHLITSLDVGGTEVSLFRLLSRVNREQFESKVISLIEPGDIGKRIRELGIEVRTLGLRRSAVAPTALLRLASWLRRDRPDLLMTWLYHADLLGLIAGKLAGIRSIIWNLRASNMDMSKYRVRSRRTLRLCTALSRMPSAIVVNSESGKRYHSQLGYRPSEWVLIRNGVDPAQFKPNEAARKDLRRELGLSPEELLVGLVARFDPMKDHHNFISAARITALKSDSVHFVLAGRGVDCNNKILAPFLNRPPLAGRVHLLGERNDITHVIAALDVACSSSRSEAFPNTIAEAMSCGVLCVATNAGDSAAIIGETGIVVAPGDADALAQGLIRAISMNSAERQVLGSAARERVIQNFSLDRCVSQYEELFERFTQRPARALNSPRKPHARDAS